jgi:DEAD/DEAH box helicase
MSSRTRCVPFISVKALLGLAHRVSSTALQTSENATSCVPLTARDGSGCHAGAQVSATALRTSENVLMCAPTGAGKTNVAMLTILHTIGLHRDEATGEIDKRGFKIVYVAPMKVGMRTGFARLWGK